MTPTLEEFLKLPSESIYDLVYPQQLSISLLLNGTRRVYIAEHFDTPPTDYSYLADCLEHILVNIGRLLTMLAEHGLVHIFLPSFSEDQQDRHPAAFKYLLKGLEGLHNHPAVVQAYKQSNYAVRFYGDMSYLPKEVIRIISQAPCLSADKPQHTVYYGIDGGNPHNYLLRLGFEFGMANGRPPSWDEMLELYYGNRTLRPLDILVAFNRIYARLGIPPLLDGNDRIYATPVTPLVLNETALRKILYDCLYNFQDRGRMYTDIHPNEIQRLKSFYAANQDTVIGLLQKYEDLCYPLPAPNWPAEMG